MTLEQLVELGYDLASKVLITTTEELLSSFTVAKEDGSIDIFHCPWGDNEEKRAAVLEIGRTIIGMKEPVTGYCMVSEVWMSHYKRGEKKRAEMPMKDPQRREAVVALASDGKDHIFRSWEIGRDEAGRCVSLTHTENPGRFESWMSEAMDRALEMQRLKKRIVQEYKDKGEVTLEGLPKHVAEAIKRYTGQEQ